MTGLIKLARTLLGGLLLLVFGLAAVILWQAPSQAPTTAASGAIAPHSHPLPSTAVTSVVGASQESLTSDPQGVRQMSINAAAPPPTAAAAVPHLDWLRQVHARHVGELQAQVEALRLGRKAQRDLARKEHERFASGEAIYIPQLEQIVIGRTGRLARFGGEVLNVLAPDEALMIRGSQVYLLRGVETSRMVSGQTYQIADVDVRVDGPFAYKTLLGVEQRVPIITLIDLTPAIDALRSELSSAPPSRR